MKSKELPKSGFKGIPSRNRGYIDGYCFQAFIYSAVIPMF